ncbi:MarR family transcriptional regulator [Streptomyces sp. NPDC008125]|uniref:MarR family winged helix-turn-helix transcriptional regulator n=1 Tax=Streptomyces sp. NPDC008125 TaxID=3364811 RepID=UPI0036E4AD72
MSAQEPHAADLDDPESGSDAAFDLVAEMLPRMAQLSNTLNKGRLPEHAMETAGLALERPSMSVLVTLHMAGAPLRIGEIAARMQVVGPHVTRQVNGLEKRGLVRRVTDPDDQRARLIEPTPEGAAGAERYMRTILGWFGGALADWSDRDRRELGRLLGRLVDDFTRHLSALDAE